MGRYIGLPHFSQAQRRPIDRPARTKRVNFNKINVNFEIFCLHVIGYSNTKESFPSCLFVVMASGKCEPHTYFTFLQRILTSKHMKKFNIFCIIYVAMSYIHFSGLDNVKITCITQVSFKITIRKRRLH